jgi:LemA protein
MKKILIAVALLFALVVGGFVLFYFYGTSIYDGAVTRQEKVDQMWADVQSDYQRRADLIPNLVSTVQGAAANEKEILTQVTQARSGISAATTPAELDKQAAVLNRSISILFERYPEIRSTENFQMLQASLEGTENRIKKSRSDYNEGVKDFNTYVRGFWRSKALSLVSSEDDNFKKREMFEAQPGSENAPKVDFNKK